MCCFSGLVVSASALTTLVVSQLAWVERSGTPNSSESLAATSLETPPHYVLKDDRFRLVDSYDDARLSTSIYRSEAGVKVSVASALVADEFPSADQEARGARGTSIQGYPGYITDTPAGENASISWTPAAGQLVTIVADGVDVAQLAQLAEQVRRP
jgi:hypothetical protein